MNTYQRLFKELQKEKEMSPKDANDHIMVFDGLNTFIRSFGATPAYNEDGDHIGGITGFLYSIGKLSETLNQADVLLHLMDVAVTLKEEKFTKVTRQTEPIKLNCVDSIIMKQV